MGSKDEGGGRLRWGRRERSLIIRDRPRCCGGPGQERPQQAGGARRFGGAAGRVGVPGPLRAAGPPPAALLPSAHRAPAGAALRGRCGAP